MHGVHVLLQDRGRWLCRRRCACIVLLFIYEDPVLGSFSRFVAPVRRTGTFKNLLT